MACIECIICYESIGTSNVVTTECGHVFHCNCLMKNASVNGFGCPMCRKEMVEQIDDEESDDDSVIHSLIDDGSTDDESNETFDAMIHYDPDEQEDYSLRGFRWLFNRIQSEPEIARNWRLDGNSFAISRVSMRNIIRNLEPELNAVVSTIVSNPVVDLDETQMFDADELESENRWHKSEEFEKKLDSLANNVITKLSPLISNEDLWNAYLAIAMPQHFYGGKYEKADDSIMRMLKGDSEIIEIKSLTSTYNNSL